MPEDLDTTLMLSWIEEIRSKEAKIDKKSQELTDLRSNTSFNTIFSDANYISKLLFYNENYIKVNSYSTSEWVAEIDSLITQESKHFTDIIQDSVPREIMEKEMIEELRLMEEICKLAKVDLNEMKNAGKIRFPYKYELYLQAIYVDAIRKAEKAHLQSISFNEEVGKALKSQKTTVNQIESRMKKQDELKEKNYEYIAEMTEKEHKRHDSFRADIEKKAKAWKEKYTEK